MKPGLILMTFGILMAYLLAVNQPERGEGDLTLSSPPLLDNQLPVLVTAESSSFRNEAPDHPASLKFGDYPCSPDCSEHEAGYQWGMEQGISDPDNCSGNTGSFIEGCRVYAEERQSAATAKHI
jgi:hypothetical protein